VSSPTQYFRAGVGAVIINDQGLVLAVERADLPGAWQLPQGGLEAEEETLQAAMREVFEETGIAERDLELLEALPEPLAYELPVGARSEKTGRGQAQYWFLFRFRGSDERITLKGGDEFRAWSWMPFDRLLSLVVEFRKPVYRRLVERLQRYISKQKGT
jgi:putative (di)nucleoside polyphosphate hydrolase